MSPFFDPASAAVELWQAARTAVKIEEYWWSSAEADYFSRPDEQRDETGYCAAQMRWGDVCDEEERFLARVLQTKPTTLAGALGILDVLLQIDGGEMESRHIPAAVRNVRDCVAAMVAATRALREPERATART